MDFNQYNDLEEQQKALNEKVLRASFGYFSMMHVEENKNTVNECILYVLLYGIASLQSEMAEINLRQTTNRKKLTQRFSSKELKIKYGFSIAYNNRIKFNKRNINIMQKIEKIFFVLHKDYIMGEEFIYVPIRNIRRQLLILNNNNLIEANNDLKLLLHGCSELIYKSGLGLKQIISIAESLSITTTTTNREEIANFLDLLRKNTIVLEN